jgi:hypothetical protein
MNQFHSSKELPPSKDMRYKIRCVTIHDSQGGGFQDKETGRKKREKKGKGNKKGIRKKKGEEEEELGGDGMTLEAHYYGYLHNFLTSQWYKLVMMLMKWRKRLSWKMPRIRPTCCITSAVDQRSLICVIRKIKLYVSR